MRYDPCEYCDGGECTDCEYTFEQKECTAAHKRGDDLAARLAEVEQERDRYRRALEDVKKHLDTIGGDLAKASTTYHIIMKALEG